MEKQKIIFLDFDGVLNHEIFYERRYQHMKKNNIQFGRTGGIMGDKFGDAFCEFSTGNLKKLIDKTGAKLVITSTWRHMGVKKLKEMWKLRNMPGEIIDITSSLDRFEGCSMPRGLEIQKWLESKNFNHWNYTSKHTEETDSKSLISTYAIIDDDVDMLYEQKDNFVKSSRNSGFNKKCLNKALKILSKNLK